MIHTAFRSKRSLQCGQTLIELLIALGIISVVIIAVTSLVLSSLSNAQQGKNQYLATKYAQQGMELVRKVRDDNYLGFRNYNGTYCLDKNQLSLGSPRSSCITPNVDNFIRSVIIQQSGCAINVSRAIITVSWTDGKCTENTYCHTSEHASCFSTVPRTQTP